MRLEARGGRELRGGGASHRARLLCPLRPGSRSWKDNKSAAQRAEKKREQPAASSSSSLGLHFQGELGGRVPECGDHRAKTGLPEPQQAPSRALPQEAKEGQTVGLLVLKQSLRFSKHCLPMSWNLRAQPGRTSKSLEKPSSALMGNVESCSTLRYVELLRP